MVRPAAILSILALLAACAAEPVEDVDLSLPLPPPAPPRPPALRQARATVGTAEAAAFAALNGEPAAAADELPGTSPPPSWHVARDGVIGCADPATLAVLGQAAERTPRMLAEARAAGGCRTTFRMNAWAAEAVEPDAVRLRLLNGTPLTLWFRRGDVTAP